MSFGAAGGGKNEKKKNNEERGHKCLGKTNKQTNK